MACQSRPYHFRFFKGCLPQILFGTLLKTLTHFSILPIFLDFCYDQSGEKWQWKDDSPLTSVFLETNFSQKFNFSIV